MTSANYHYIALHARLQGVVITVWERGQKVKCQSALSWNTESNDGACVLEERSRCGVGGMPDAEQHKVKVISELKS